jgi:deoxycytidylate deaminase
MIVNSGIIRIVYEAYYDDPLADDILAETEIAVEQFKG